jgi:hypothetical protein
LRIEKSMKRAVKIASDQQQVAGPVPSGTALFALLQWLAGRVSRQLSASSGRAGGGKGRDSHAPADEQNRTASADERTDG